MGQKGKTGWVTPSPAPGCSAVSSFGAYSQLFIPLYLHIRTPKLNALNVSSPAVVQCGCLGLLQYTVSLK